MAVTYPTVDPQAGQMLQGRNQENLNQMFSNSPLPGYLVKGDYDQKTVENICKVAMNGSKPEGGGLEPDQVTALGAATPGTINDSGYMFGTFDLNYKNAPDMADVETGAGGLPGSPYTPNLNSPGEGSTDASDLEEYTGTYQKTNQFGSGMSPTSPEASPHTTSGKDGISSQLAYSKEFSDPKTVGNYISGRSYEFSQGKPE